eukprot:751976-Amphidinium_carterae.1
MGFWGPAEATIDIALRWWSPCTAIFSIAYNHVTKLGLQQTIQQNKTTVVGLKKLCHRRYQDWEFSQTPLSHGITDKTKTWGQLRSIVTFNTNKIPWTSFGSYLQLVTTEVSYSVLCLQELYDGALQEGWWITNQHAVLVSRTHDTALVALVLHADYVPTQLPAGIIYKFKGVIIYMCIQ